MNEGQAETELCISVKLCSLVRGSPFSRLTGICFVRSYFSSTAAAAGPPPPAGFFPFAWLASEDEWKNDEGGADIRDSAAQSPQAADRE